MPNLPTRYDTDEQDLNRVKWGYLVFTGVLAVMAVLSLVSLFGYASYLYMVPFGIIGAISTGLYAYANYRCAKAIEQRVDPQITYFVAGMNMMAFPFGTLLSWYTWSVMTRPTVQELYAQGTPALAPAKPKAVGRKASSPRLVQAEEQAPEMHWADAVAHVDEAEEKLWREIEAKAKASKEATKSKDDDEAANNGPIKLVPGDS
jgi:hypothetical protein